MKKGCVSLVGAGPGDPGLLTLKALQRIREADWIIYDTLANPQHLIHAKASARSLCVGVGFRHKKLSQDRINRLILRQARKGKNVLRLKGGDPYLFGRGGEEALFLEKHGIPFEVIPGVTSATGCATYAGIPLTHRDHNASVTFLTGHRAHDARLDTIDWEKIASTGGTLVIYMGFYNLGTIAERLVNHGMAPQTPVAVVEWGTLPRQRSCDGTLKTIAAEVKRNKFQAPCMIIIGDVVRLREKLNWFERLPLFGKRVLVTRLRQKAGVLSEKLRALGAHVTELPVSVVRLKGNSPVMRRAIRHLTDYDWLCFSSTHGVESFFDGLRRSGKDVRALAGVKVSSIGPETTRALTKQGLKADLQPAVSETGAMLTWLKRAGQLPGKRFLLVKPDIAPDDLEKGLRRAGARVDRVTAYQTRPLRISKNKLRELAAGPLDFVTFTSASSAIFFVKAVGLRSARALSKKGALISIGPQTSRALRKIGLIVHRQARRHDIDGLVEAVRP